MLIVAALIGAGAGIVTAKIDAAIDNYAAGASTVTGLVVTPGKAPTHAKGDKIVQPHSFIEAAI